MNNQPQPLKPLETQDHDGMMQTWREVAEELFGNMIDLAENNESEAFFIKRVGNKIIVDSWFDSTMRVYIFKNEDEARKAEELALRKAEELDYAYFDLDIFESIITNDVVVETII